MKRTVKYIVKDFSSAAILDAVGNSPNYPLSLKRIPTESSNLPYIDLFLTYC